MTTLINQLENNNDLCLCGIILTEVHQGIKNPNEYHQVESMMNSLLFIDMTKETFILQRDNNKKIIRLHDCSDCYRK